MTQPCWLGSIITSRQAGAAAAAGAVWEKSPINEFSQAGPKMHHCIVYTVYMIRCTDTQMHRYTDASLYTIRYDTQMHRYADTQMHHCIWYDHRCTDAPLYTIQYTAGPKTQYIYARPRLHTVHRRIYLVWNQCLWTAVCIFTTWVRQGIWQEKPHEWILKSVSADMCVHALFCIQMLGWQFEK